MLSVSFGSNAAYLYQHVEERTDAVRGNYYLSAAEHGEPPGVWLPGGAEALGLTGDVDKDTMAKLYDDFAHPVTGEQLGRRPYRFADQAERLVAAVEAEGGEVLPERMQELSLSIAKTHREARNYADLTLSMPKSWSVLHASLERAGRHDDAEKVWSAIMEGADAGLAYLKEHAGYSRAGRHGTEAAGRTSGRWVEGKDWIVSAWRHHTSPDGDPQLHVHLAVLNRVQCEDGKWRTLDSRAITRARPGAAAVAERVAEEALVRELNVRFASRADGLAREIVGIDEEARDLFSSRRRAISDTVAERVAEYEARYGHMPNAYTLRLMSEQATLETRLRKPVHPPSRAELLDEWEQRTRTALGEHLDELAGKVHHDGEPQMEVFDPRRVVERALADLEGSRSVWTRHDLVAAVNRELPDCLGGLTQPQVRAVVDELVDSALASGDDVVKLTAPELVAVPDELRRADGRSVYEPPTAERYATVRQLELEEIIVAASRRADAPAVERERAERLVATSPMSQTQSDAVLEILTSGRDVETFIGAPGVGKTFTSAELARLWTEATGQPVLGLTTSERARQVLEAEGFAHSSNIARWQYLRAGGLQANYEHWNKIRSELRDVQTGGPLQQGRALTDAERQLLATCDRKVKDYSAQMLGPNHLVIVDEASMVTTQDLADIVLVAQASGAKVVLSGDDRQLGAVGAGGMFRLLAQDDSAVRLEDPRRFVNAWEADASLRLRAGDVSALVDYDRHGRFVDGSRDEMLAAAKQAFVGDHLLGKQALLVVPTNELASQLSSEVQAELIRLGVVQSGGVELRDHNRVGVGDMIATRLNERDLGVVNRETYLVRDVRADSSLIVSEIDSRGNAVEATKVLPPDYVAGEVELAYASTAHSAQGRTVERAHSLIEPDLTTREALLVGQTRGSELNAGYVVTHDLDTEIGQPERQDRMTVLTQIVERDDDERAVLEVLRDELDASESLARLEPQWADVVGAGNVNRYAEQLRTHLGDEMFERVQHDDAASSIYRSIRAHELAGGDTEALIERVTHDELHSADSPASVLTWRISQAEPERHDTAKTYTERTPERDDPAGLWAKQLAEAMDNRVRDLGEQAVAEQPAWSHELGPVPEDPTDRLEWTRRAGAVAAYREAHGYRGEDAIGAAPPRGAVEARASWDLAYDALGRPETDRDITRGTNGDLERIAGTWKRELQWAPANVDQKLADTHVAARRWETEASIEDAELHRPGQDDQERETSQLLIDAKRRLAAELRERAEKLETIAAARHDWYDETAEVRRRAALAQRELDRRARVEQRQAPAAPAEHTAGVRVVAERQEHTEPAHEIPGHDAHQPEHTSAPAERGQEADFVPTAESSPESEKREVHAEQHPASEPAEHPAAPHLPQDEPAQEAPAFNIDHELARAQQAREIIAERRAERDAEERASLERNDHQAVEQQRDRGSERNIGPHAP